MGEFVFYYCSNNRETAIQESVKSIGDYVFYKCSSLEKIILPIDVTRIGDHAFSDCSSLKEIVIPKSVSSIGNYAFSDCSSLKEIVIPKSVKNIGNHTFSGCSNLWNIVIPESVTSIGRRAFADCSRLIHIVIPESVTSIGCCAFEGCSALSDIIIPRFVNNNGDYTFLSCSSLKEIDIPDSVNSIGVNAFYGCYNLRNVKIPDSVEQIGENAFFGCPIKEVRLSHTTNYLTNSFDEVTKVVKAKVFISYSWDDEQHKDWVRKLAEDLQKNGVYVILDQWELKTGKLIPQFVKKSIAEAERVILIMTPNYKKKSDNLEGGVGYEYSVIQKELFANLASEKMIPILRVGSRTQTCPEEFMDRLYLDFSENAAYENSFGLLIREIFKADYL